MGSIAVLLAAGLCEIGGGYLIWLWLREGKSVLLGVLGGAILVLYGAVATLQPANFGRAYAAYGGAFITLSVIWGWSVDRKTPDRADLIGGLVALVGAGIILFAPRK